MVKRASAQEQHWFIRQITVGNLLSVGAITFGFAGFYYNTASAIDSQAKEIASINRKLDASEKKEEKQQREVLTERATLRAEMIQRAEKTADGLSELSKQTAVLSAQLATISSEIVKIGNKVDAITSTYKR